MILVTGADGQLGAEFINTSLRDQIVATTKNELDISSKQDIEAFCLSNSIKVIINCAAYTQVDLAEDQKEEAILVNQVAVKNLVEVCKEQSIFLIHFSTDYVFDGSKNVPYIESDLESPTSVYGKSKLQGEVEVKSSGIDAAVFRLSWVYSNRGKNFLLTMLRLGEQQETLSVVFDQVGTPTYTKDVAEIVSKHLDQIRSIKGVEVFHLSNEGVCSWYDFAQAIFIESGLKTLVKPIRSSEFPSRVQRPHYSVLDKSKIKAFLNIQIPHWRESLIQCLKERSL
ncbi:MAG: dTDP-4-dehydrorhamnose reductase [Bdellovibrionales bacterium]|nr:dTDP-4-dehydrorhamnose reductase [Bdellovibrionales bacterium]